MNDIAISLKNVSKYYKLYNSPKDRLKEAISRKGNILHKKFYATKNIDLEIKKGEILGIVGKNGSGKSTLLKLITGVLKPDEGSIEVNGKISALLELGSGFNPEFTGMQNIFFYGTILGFRKEEMEEKIDAIIAFADIGEFIDQPLKNYSSGMKSRLGFAVAVHIDPEILILDEVLSVGDELFKRKSYAKMEEFFKSGKTIIYVSHNSNSIKQLCTRAIFLLDGEMILDSTPHTVITSYEKYFFSDKKNQDKIKSEIKSYHKEKYSKVSKRIKSVDEQKEKDYFISGMKTEETIIRNRRVDIFDITILNEKRETVNVLQIGKMYTLSYKVHFDEECYQVKFGHLIKNEKGVWISGYTLPSRKEALSIVKAGEEYIVQAEFQCDVNKGSYFFEISVTSDIGDDRVYLIWKKDVYMVKVVGNNYDFWSMVNIWSKNTLMKTSE